MGNLKYMRRRLMRLWLQRRTREVAVAVALTVAAAGFIAGTLLRSDSGADRTATHISARKNTAP
jgi:hypothetical protein